MKAAVDLHIHSALSPCADNDMTPNNIVNMAYLKNLDIIAVTDHNSLENYPAVAKCASERNIVAVPGIELETREEVHLVCLFPGYDSALKMQERVYGALPDIENKENIFGQQYIMDEDDNVTGQIKRMLITATNMSIDDVFVIMDELGGAVIPAHIDRDSYSIISNLGIIPEYLKIKYLELSRTCSKEEYRATRPELDKYKLIRSSDAHYLSDILERETFIEVEELSINALIKSLRP